MHQKVVEAAVGDREDFAHHLVDDFRGPRGGRDRCAQVDVSVRVEEERHEVEDLVASQHPPVERGMVFVGPAHEERLQVDSGGGEADRHGGFELLFARQRDDQVADVDHIEFDLRVFGPSDQGRCCFFDRRHSFLPGRLSTRSGNSECFHYLLSTGLPRKPLCTLVRRPPQAITQPSIVEQPCELLGPQPVVPLSQQYACCSAVDDDLQPAHARGENRTAGG